MRTNTVASVVGSLGLLLGVGTALANQQPEVTTGQQVADRPAGGQECRDAGVTVAFKTGSAELDQNARGALDGVATWLRANSDRTMELQGFADTTGNTEANLVLSEHRADAVKNYLVSHGIDPARVATVGRGEHTGHLPANGRAVTFFACQPAGGAPAAAESAQAAPPPAPAWPVAPAPYEPATPVPYPIAPMGPPPPPRWATGYGFALMAGGGFTDFTNETMSTRTGGGGAWDARFVGGTNYYIGFEAAYVGAAHGIHTLGPSTNNNPTLVANGLETTVRLNAPIRRGNSLFEPYGYAGVGYSVYTIQNFNSVTGVYSDFNNDDTTLNVPVGGGFAYAYKAFIADVRGGWTATYFNDLVLTQSGTGTLNNWGIGGQAGFIF